MFLAALATLALIQAPAAQQLPPSPVQRIVVTPANPTVEAQDTLRLRAQALDGQATRSPAPRSAS